MTVTALARTLDQELIALARGASLACPVCSEFVLHVRGAHGLAIACPECRSILAEGTTCPRSRYPRWRRPGDRGRAASATRSRKVRTP